MPSLTPELWEAHYPKLRDYVEDRWPHIDDGKLYAIVGDFGALVDLLAATNGTSSDLARQQLLGIEVAEEDVEIAGRRSPPAGIEQLRLGAGFGERDRELVESNLAKLERRLRRFPADAVELEVSVQERGTTSQQVVLEAWLPKFPHMAVTSGQEDLGMALREVRDNLWRQIDDAVNRRKEPG